MFSLISMGTTRIPHHKNTANKPSVVFTDVKEILLPLSQHIGAPAIPIVKVGDTVTVGQKLAEANGYVSAPIYSSVSGKVIKIEDYLRSDGKIVSAIRIQSDGLMTKCDSISIPKVDNLEDIIIAARESGIVGLGGAGFPLSVKLDAIKKGTIDKIIINGAECEPYITSDTRTMLEDSNWIKKGVDLLVKYATNVNEIIIGIEKNKPDCIKNLTKLFAEESQVRVVKLPETYPQGGEKVIIYNTVNRIVPEGKLPADVGVIVINVTTLAILAKYIYTGEPLISRRITIDGSAVSEPQNVIAPIGVSLGELIEFAGGLKAKAGKVVYGGPMMGICASSLDEPTLKTTGGITVFNVNDSISAEPTACIHCGRCIRSCPLRLSPIIFADAVSRESREEQIAILEKNKVMLCMECGCCSYVCPANRRLVQNNRIGKSILREHMAHINNLKK